MELIESLLENPESLSALAYGTATTTAVLYGASKNDFGASGRTDRELESYLEEADTGPHHPLQTYKSWEYRKELNSRDADLNLANEIDEDYIEQEEGVSTVAD